jgi:uncharacterized membrane protein YraQ (UPF0718 family)
MPWTASDQQTAENRNNTFRQEFNTRLDGWRNTLSAGAIGQGHAAVEDTLTRWRAHMNELQSSSESLLGNDSLIDKVGVLASQVAEEKSVLEKLRSEAGTRADQATSVNPKIVGIPATNILGLNRVFRSSTRLFLLIASIVFGVLALGAISYFIYSTGVVQYTANGFQTPVMLGGRRH